MSQADAAVDISGLVFDVDSFAVHDGPGVRMSVYLKGCPLACKWCHSPESQSAAPELAYAQDRCVSCRTCVERCLEGVHRFDPAGRHTIKREVCVACGRCADTCLSGALSIKGYRVTAGEIADKAERLKPFFSSSGGGITLTGGEITMQARFAAAILMLCRARGIHTAIETSGACSWERLERVAEHADLILFDLKLVDDDLHRRYVGISNQRVLENLSRLAEHEIQIRVPLIPGITDTQENLIQVFGVMRGMGLSSLALLPYNAAAGAKYEWLDREYAFDCASQNEEELAAALAMARAAGLDAVIG